MIKYSGMSGLAAVSINLLQIAAIRKILRPFIPVRPPISPVPIRLYFVLRCSDILDCLVASRSIGCWGRNKTPGGLTVSLMHLEHGHLRRITLKIYIDLPNIQSSLQLIPQSVNCTNKTTPSIAIYVKNLFVYGSTVSNTRIFVFIFTVHRVS